MMPVLDFLGGMGEARLVDVGRLAQLASFSNPTSQTVQDLEELALRWPCWIDGLEA